MNDTQPRREPKQKYRKFNNTKTGAKKMHQTGVIISKNGRQCPQRREKLLMPLGKKGKYRQELDRINNRRVPENCRHCGGITQCEKYR